MTDASQVTHPQDDQLLEDGEGTPELEAGDDVLELESGDDLAAQALADADKKQIPGVSAPKADPAALAETLTALQNVIERNAIELDRIKEELKLHRDSLKNVFENDTELAEAEEKAQQVSQQVKERKSRLQSSAQALQLKADIGELTERKKEVEEALNNHLLNYYQVTGAKVFDTSTGEQREFDIRATMKGGKKSAKNED